MKHIWRPIMQVMNDTEVTFITRVKFNKRWSETNLDLDRSWAYFLADIVNFKHRDISYRSLVITLIPNTWSFSFEQTRICGKLGLRILIFFWGACLLVMLCLLFLNKVYFKKTNHISFYFSINNKQFSSVVFRVYGMCLIIMRIGRLDGALIRTLWGILSGCEFESASSLRLLDVFPWSRLGEATQSVQLQFLSHLFCCCCCCLLHIGHLLHL